MSCGLARFVQFGAQCDEVAVTGRTGDGTSSSATPAGWRAAALGLAVTLAAGPALAARQPGKDGVFTIYNKGGADSEEESPQEDADNKKKGQ